MNRARSAELYQQAVQYFPGGVNSPVRAFQSVGGTPLFIEKGDGCRIWDVDGNEYIDFCCSWGPLILGHNNAVVREQVSQTITKGMSFGAPTELENRLADLILSNHRFIEKIRFVNSGTEATMSAIRLARGFTGKDKIIKFEGCYHGHADHLLVKAGSGLATFGTSSSAGVPEAFAAETIVLPLADRQAVEAAFSSYGDDLAAIIIEPIPANNGLLLQDPAYLEFLRDVASANNTILIFDEVISGFRIGFEGAAGYYDIQPDIITFGKIIGGGMPVGAYAASAEVMAQVAPEGSVYQAGTLSGNPVAMAAGIAQLTECLQSEFYENLEARTKAMCADLNQFASDQNYPVKVFSIGSIFWIAFTEQDQVNSASEIDPSSMEHFSKLHALLLDRGVYMGPSGYEVGFISSAHQGSDLQTALSAFKESLQLVFSQHG